MGVIRGQASVGLLTFYQGDMATSQIIYEECLHELQSKDIDILTKDSAILNNLGYLSLILGDYQFALRYYEARSVNSRTRIFRMTNNSRLGLALLGIGNESRAIKLLFEVWFEAIDMGALQVALETLLGIAQLSIIDSSLKIQILNIIKKHPASNRFSRNHARDLLAEIESTETIVTDQQIREIILDEVILLIQSYTKDLDKGLPSTTATAC